MKLSNKQKTIQEQTDLALNVFAETAEKLEALSKKAEELADIAYLQSIERAKEEEYYRSISDKNAAIAGNIRKIFSH